MASPTASELGLNLGSYVTANVAGPERYTRQGIFAGFNKEGSAMVLSAGETLVCEPDVYVVPDENLMTRFNPVRMEHLDKFRQELTRRAELAAKKAGTTLVESPEFGLVYQEPPKPKAKFYRPSSVDPKLWAFGNPSIDPDDGY